MKRSHQFIFCLKLLLSSKLLTPFCQFLSFRWFKIKCTFINENNISSVSILISFAPFYSFIFYFFIYFWCKLRTNIRITFFFKILYIVPYEGVVEKSFFRMFVISLILINWYSLTRSTIYDKFLNQIFYSFLSFIYFQNFNFRSVLF